MRTILLVVFSSIFVAGVYPQRCNICLKDTCRPSMVGIPAFQFNANDDCKKLRTAMVGFGTNEDVLISVLTARSESQRQDINNEFIKFKSNLASSIHGETSSRFRNIMIALITPLVTFYTKELGQAVKAGDRSVISQILGILPPCVIQQVAIKYQELNEMRNLYDDLNKVTLKDTIYFSMNDYVSFVLSLVEGNRVESTVVDRKAAAEDARRLVDAGVGTWGTIESVFVEILTKRSIPQLREILNQYDLIRKTDSGFISFEKDVESEFGLPTVREIIMILARNAINQPLYFAQEIEELMKKYWFSSEDENKIIRIMRGRGDIDMEDIKEAYRREYKQNLADRIDGAFKLKTRFPRTLLGIVNGK